jgi:16S rRNA (cytosine1402-N4)-methyltransferase
MLSEVLDLLRPRPGQVILDGTAGGGGHAAALLARVRPGGRLFLLDADPEAIRRLKARFGQPADIEYVHANFCDFDQVLAARGQAAIDGALLDLGLSSDQLAGDRGFSFERPAPLDMRLSPDQPLTAWEVVNRWDERQLAEAFSRYGDQPYARRIARAIVRHRPIERTDRLAHIIEAAQPPRYRRRKRIHPATRVFQVIRMLVNDEAASLDAFCRKIFDRLAVGGRVAILAFHSAEDRIVKRRFREAARAHRAGLVTRKPVTPTVEEVRANPRSRSARLRVAERVARR